jgi:hypothetical protein
VPLQAAPRRPLTSAWVSMWALGLALTGGTAWADGLSDLKAALARTQGTSTISATFSATTWRREGEGKDLEETSGAASVQIEEGINGLRLQYSRDAMMRADAESRAREKDSKAKTPFTNALRALNAAEARDLTWASQHLLRSLEKTTYKSERADTLNGKAVRVVSFEIGTDRIPEKERKYVKKFDGSIDVWIDNEGVPLQSVLKYSVSGRAFLVITYDGESSEEFTYTLVGDRLIALRKEVRSKTTSSAEKSEEKTVRTLALR